MQTKILLNELPYSESNVVEYLDLLTDIPYFHYRIGRLWQFQKPITSDTIRA